MVIREGSVQGWGARDTVLISRKPFSQEDIERGRAALKAGGMQQVYLPGDSSTNEFATLLKTDNPRAVLSLVSVRCFAGRRQPALFLLYGSTARSSELSRRVPQHSADYKINRAVPLLFGLMGISILATAVILLLPPLVLGSKLPRERGVQTMLLYFLCIGIGYILVQVALIQKFVMLLGHPTYALTVIIFSMLVFSGMGSFFSRKFIGPNDDRLKRVLIAGGGPGHSSRLRRAARLECRHRVAASGQDARDRADDRAGCVLYGHAFPERSRHAWNKSIPLPCDGLGRSTRLRAFLVRPARSSLRSILVFVRRSWSAE